jgi:hypothetical protein
MREKIFDWKKEIQFKVADDGDGLSSFWWCVFFWELVWLRFGRGNGSRSIMGRS